MCRVSFIGTGLRRQCWSPVRVQGELTLRAVAAGGIASAAVLAVLGVARHSVFTTAGLVALTAATLTVFIALLGILAGATVHGGFVVFILVAASHVFAVAAGHRFAGVGLLALIFLMIAAGASGFRSRGSRLWRGGLLGHNRQPSGQR